MKASQSIQQPQPSDSKSAKLQQQLNKSTLKTLPPGINGSVYGHMFVEIGDLNWLIYEGQNYMDAGSALTGEVTKGLFSLFVNIKMFGDSTKGIYLKFANGMKKKEQVINKYKYDIVVSEKSFERYLYDMETLVVDIYDSDKSVTIGTSRIRQQLFIKKNKGALDEDPLLEMRGVFPIELIGNPKVKIGEFSLSIITSFTDAFNPKGLQPRNQINLEDSFIMNEKLAEQMSIQEKAFADDRVPQSTIMRTNTNYNKNIFEQDLDQRPSRERKDDKGKENKRNLINIDENEDTFHNQNEFERIISRSENLQKELNDKLDEGKAWETIHGNHQIPKRYIPPFLHEESKGMNEDELDNIYAMEIEAGNDPIQEKVEQPVKKEGLREETLHVRDMKFIRMKIQTLRIENEELLHSLIEDSFNMVVELPLPDVYQKKVTYQQIKLNNYDIASFNEFMFNSLTLYNFKIDEETFNQLVSSQIKFSIEGKNTFGTLNMNRVLLAPGYKLEVSVPLERKILIQEEEKKQPIKQVSKKQGVDKKKLVQVVKEPIQQQFYMKSIGYISVAINLQRGDNEEELARDYQIRLQQMEEKRKQEESERQQESVKRMKFMQSAEPVFAQLYINIDSIRNLCLNNDGSMNQQMHDDSFNRQNSQPFMRTENAFGEKRDDGMNFRRNLYVQFKAFPTLDKLKTTIQFNESEPKFNYRSQFPLMMSPEILEKLEKFIFVLEVWDQQSPSKEEFIGLVKIPLSSFCHSMKTSDDQIFSLNFMADQFCIYPMVIADDFFPIYSPKHAENIGELKISIALGTPLQINRQIQKEQEQEKQMMQITFQSKIEQTVKSKVEFQQEEFVRIRREEDEERKRKMEEESKKLEPEKSSTPKKLLEDQLSLQQSMANMLKKSLNLSMGGSKGDFDLRKMTYLNSLRKLFEEARTGGISELNNEEIFKDSNRNFDGSVKKDDFVYSILNQQNFTLTRTELSQICSLLLNINRDDNNNMDLDELQMSYRSYLKYYELVEQRICDLLEKFKLNISKKLESQEELESLSQQILDRATDSKLTLDELKQLMENNGIFIRDALYDQLSVYFDLDRNGSVYMSSFCEYLRVPSMQNFNFFKVSPSILSNQIEEFVKNAMNTNKEALSNLEQEFKVEIYKQKMKTENVSMIPDDFLLEERINAKLFQFKMKKQGIVLTLWEVMTIFEHLNTHYAKMFYEPQRYHVLPFSLFYKYISQEDYESKIKQNQQVKASTDSAFALAQDLNNKKKKRSGDSSGEGIYSENSQSDQEEDEDVIVIKEESKKMMAKDITFSREKKKRRAKNGDVDVEDKSIQMQQQMLPDGDNIERPFNQVKHVFEIKVKELKNIPILDKMIKDSKLNDYNKPPGKGKGSKYIQNIAVKYSFPLDEDEVLESDYLQLKTENLETSNQYDYNVSMSTTHTYILNKDEKIEKLFKQQTHEQDQRFNISIALYEDRREFIVGNTSLPVEDIVDLIEAYSIEEEKSQLSRTIFLYGTTFSQRENCIIGKLCLEVQYSKEKQYLSDSEILKQIESKEPYNGQQCFMHRETFVNRKIPLNAVLSVYIERVMNIKESLENLEHFAKIQQSQNKDFDEKTPKNSKQTVITGNSKSGMGNQGDSLDRKRILTQIFREGLNLSIICSLFDEDSDLKKKFPSSKYTSRLLFNTLNPIFDECFEQQVQMDTSLFEYLKNRRAVFEIRHYILNSQKSQYNDLQTLIKGQTSDRGDTARSAMTDDEQELMSNSDYIVIGYVRVPLIQLITKNNGIEGEFMILDDYKQQMGGLKLRIALNHHNGSRPLYSGSTKVQGEERERNVNNTIIDKTVNLQTSLSRGKTINIAENQYILGINFYELITKNREALFNSASIGMQINQQCTLYLKFQLFGQNFKSKFFSTNQLPTSDYYKLLQMRVFEIKQTMFIELDFSKQRDMEEAFNKPLEVQLWFKKESSARYKQPEQEILLGSFFIELNELSKQKNRRIKENEGVFYAFDGYFSLYEYEKDQVCKDRLGAKLYLIRKGKNIQKFNDQIIEYQSELSDIEVLFHNLKQIEDEITNKLDSQSKGYVELDELSQLIQSTLQAPYSEILQRLVSFMEYKNTDKIYYASLLGLPSPYFRYARRFDSFGVIEKFNKEFQSLDSHDNGFAPLGLFKQVLESELKIKEKIVDDFIQNMKSNEQKPLDVNIFSHSFKNHIDYVVLLRKLVMYYEIKHQGRSVNENLQSAREEDIESEINMKIEIQGALRVKNPINELQPPNSFVYLRLPFRQCIPNEIQTGIIANTSYPTWYYKAPNIQFNMNQENLKVLMSQGLEFEVYHSRLGGNDKQSSILIGVAYVDLSLFAYNNGLYQIEGHFHILRKGQHQNMEMLTSMNPMKLSAESLGQVRISISTSNNIQRLLEKSESMQQIKKQYSPIKEQNVEQSINFNPFRQEHVQNMSFARENEPLSQSQQIEEKLYHLMSQTQQNLESKFLQFGLTLQNQDNDIEDNEEINIKHSQNMLDLEALNKKLQETLHGRKEEDEYSSKFNADFQQTRGYNQSQNMKNQIKGVSFDQYNVQLPVYKVDSVLQQQNQVLEEDVESELDREDNIFQQNISEGSEEKVKEQQYKEEDEEFKGVPFNQTFNKKQTPGFVQFENEDDIHSEKDSSMMTSNVFEQNSLKQHSFNQQSESKKLSEEVEYDVQEMERIERILKSQKK